MKRIISFIIVALMMLTFSVTAFAEGTSDTQFGTIIISNARAGETYTLYRMATLESYSSDNYSYKLNEEWRDFFSTSQAQVYFSITNDGYLVRMNVMQDANKANMANDAMAYIADATRTVTVEKNATADADGELRIEGLTLGYYFIDTTTGTVCTINTTAPTVSVQDKNELPTVTKEVQDDANSGNGISGTFGETNDADLFDPFTFRVIIDAKRGASNYVLHDTMTNMVFIEDSVKIYRNNPETAGSELIDPSLYTVVTNSADLHDSECTFEIVFSKELCDMATGTNDVYVFYQAMLTEDAVVGGEGNPNEVYLSYGNASRTSSDGTTTFTYGVDIVKTDATGNYLDGATFTLWTAAEGGEKIQFVHVTEGLYRVAKEGESPVEKIIVEDGKTTRLTGLDGDTSYYLQEVDYPVGYNRLLSRQKFDIIDKSLDITPDDNPEKYAGTEGGVRVINSTGAVLPDTGGVGTTMFVLIGAVLVLGTGVVLATKARMAKIAE